MKSDFLIILINLTDVIELHNIVIEKFGGAQG